MGVAEHREGVRGGEAAKDAERVKGALPGAAAVEDGERGGEDARLAGCEQRAEPLGGELALGQRVQLIREMRLRRHRCRGRRTAVAAFASRLAVSCHVPAHVHQVVRLARCQTSLIHREGRGAGPAGPA